MRVLREVTDHVLYGDFNEWKYTHDQAEVQLAVLNGKDQSWRANSSVTRIVGELKALRSHVEAVQNAVPKLKQSYEETYRTTYCSDSLTTVSAEREELVAQLKGMRKGPKKGGENEKGCKYHHGVGFSGRDLRERGCV